MIAERFDEIKRLEFEDVVHRLNNFQVGETRKTFRDISMDNAIYDEDTDTIFIYDIHIFESRRF